jgi:hypothetical protein
VGRDDPAGEGRVAQGGRPDDGPRRSRSEGGGHGTLRPEATGNLDLDPIPDRIDDPADHLGVCRLPGPSAVEVHDVEPPRSEVRERPRDRDWIVRKGGLPLEVALLQSNDAATAKIDRRQDVEATCHRWITVLAF